MLPAGEGVRLAFPFFGERKFRKDGRGSGVLHGVSEHAAPSEGAKALLIFAREMHVIWIEREDGVGGSVCANPGEGAEPVIGGATAGPFDVLGCGEELALCVEHSRA